LERGGAGEEERGALHGVYASSDRASERECVTAEGAAHCVAHPPWLVRSETRLNDAAVGEAVRRSLVNDSWLR